MTEVVKPQCIASGVGIQSSNAGRLRGRVPVRRARWQPLGRHIRRVHCAAIAGKRAGTRPCMASLVLKLQNHQKGTALLAGANIATARLLTRRCGAYLALTALMLQLALSFAHVHRHDLASSGFDRADVVSVGRAHATLRAVQQLPSRLADDDDRCPICFSSFLLANSSLSAAPAGQHSVQFVALGRVFSPFYGRLFLRRHTAFLSRAPPAA